jgi:hypothetical protein
MEGKSMQIDGHNAATYVAARLAGFSFPEAEKIAYAAQYVDDATNAGIVRFRDTPFLYSRIASAHKMIDYTNLVDVENHLAWIPFHFLPGNAGLPAGEGASLSHLDRLVCRPDSHIARDMLRHAYGDREHPRGLHRLGIAMHVYADTFAHQGFVGALSVANSGWELTCGDPELDKAILATTKKELTAVARAKLKAVCQFIAKALQVAVCERKWPTEFFRSLLKDAPVGHAAADVYPDQPYLVWRYVNYKGVLVERNNPQDFSLAMDMMVRAMRAWRERDPSMELERHAGLSDADKQMATHLFRTLRDIDGEVRRHAWLEFIRRGAFSFGTEVPAYTGKGAGSWKDLALGTTRDTDTGVEQFAFRPDFLQSDWKMFHDAIQAHRSDVIHDILPRYGICAA